MQKKKNIKSAKNNDSFRFTDFLVIFIFLLIAAFSVYLFRNDLMQTITLQNVEPVGTVIVKKNTVQRRLGDRVLWDRLAKETPVYVGDLIRVAEISSAALIVKDNDIDLGENTLIRISLAPDGEGIQITLSGGSISFSAGSGGESIFLSLNGKLIQTAEGTVLSASVGEEGASIHVSEGNAFFIDDDGGIKEITSGEAITFNTEGEETLQKTVVVTHPAPNARYLKTSAQPFNINFSWNRINLQNEESLRLDIAQDRAFNNVTQTQRNLNNQAQISLETGLWHWRLSLEDAVLAEGRVTIADGSGPQLISPALNSRYRYSSDLPAINFRWTEIEDAVTYIIEISNSYEFTNFQIREFTDSSFFIASSLEHGVWYWRVRALFPHIFEGTSSFSQPAFFNIERGAVEPVAENINLNEWLMTEVPSTVDIPAGVPVALIPQEWQREPEPPRAAPPPPPEPPLASVTYIQPAAGYRFGLEELQNISNIVFRWSSVRDANAYILTLYHQTSAGRRQVIRTSPISGTSYTLNNLGLLDRGTFVWNVEAVSTARGGAIRRRGNISDTTFVMDFPDITPIQVDDSKVLYGN